MPNKHIYINDTMADNHIYIFNPCRRIYPSITKVYYYYDSYDSYYYHYFYSTTTTTATTSNTTTTTVGHTWWAL